jgi:hypothetical protein
VAGGGGGRRRRRRDLSVFAAVCCHRWGDSAFRSALGPGAAPPRLHECTARSHEPAAVSEGPWAQVTELYGGAGLIGLSAALPQCDWLRCSDENPNNLAAFLKVEPWRPGLASSVRTEEDGFASP